MNQLPEGWRWMSLGELAALSPNAITDGPFGSNLKTEHYTPSGPRVIRLQNIGEGRFNDERAHISEEHYERLSKHRVAPGDLLIALLGQKPPRACIAPDWLGPAIVKADCVKLTPHPNGPSAAYLCHALNDDVLRRRAVAHGVGRPRLTLRELKETLIPVAVPDEQDRIVAEIEKQFTRLDAAIRLLQHAQPRLKAWRASLMHHAMMGRLVVTQAALARAHGKRFEDAPELLCRVTGHVHTGGQTTGLYPLPEGWVWTELGCIAQLKGGLTKGQKRKATEVTRPVHYLRVANVQRGYLDLSEMKQIGATEGEISDLRLKVGDLLFNEGGDRDKLGRGWVWAGEIPECIHQNHVFRARLHSDLDPKFFSWFANYVGHRYFLEQGRQTTNLASINMSKLRRLPVPVAPAAEQRRIVAELERQLSVLERIEASIEEQVQRAAALRSGILRRAFIGELVPQTDSAEAVVN